MKLVIGNQKAFMSSDDVYAFIGGMEGNCFDNVVICPSYPYIGMYSKLGIKVGAQDVSISDNGKATGEVTVNQLKSLGVSYCIVGHSERRSFFAEDDDLVNRKITKLLDNDMVPILCVGESFEDKENGRSVDVVLNEVCSAFNGVNFSSLNRIIVAYEPIWSISDGIRAGVTPSCDEIKGVISSIKNYVKDNYGVSIKVVYGGSVNLSNVDALNDIDILDGYLIGGASLKVDSFVELAKKCL